MRFRILSMSRNSVESEFLKINLKQEDESCHQQKKHLKNFQRVVINQVLNESLLLHIFHMTVIKASFYSFFSCAFISFTILSSLRKLGWYFVTEFWVWWWSYWVHRMMKRVANRHIQIFCVFTVMTFHTFDFTRSVIPFFFVLLFWGCVKFVPRWRVFKKSVKIDSSFICKTKMSRSKLKYYIIT